MNQEINTLINGYLDGTLSDVELASLGEWIENDQKNAELFADAVIFDNRLQTEVNAAEYTTAIEIVAIEEESKSKSKSGLIPRLAIALSVCLVIGLGLFASTMQMSDDQVVVKKNDEIIDSQFATVTKLIDVEWKGSQPLQIGSRVSNRTIQLSSGFLRLVFDDGVEVTLQGPAQYEVLGLGKTRLTAGLLTATVPPGAEGFTVDTPEAEIVDLGTSFGINLQEDGISQVSVFDGEVEVTATNDPDTRLLKEGESIRVNAGKNIESVEFDPKPFEKVWPISSGIVGSTESIRFIPPWPKRIRFIKSDEYIFVAPEGRPLELEAPLHVNISQPGKYAAVSDLTPHEFLPGTRVRSYFLHFHPAEDLPPRRAVRISGSITFDEPILGLIVRHEELKASMRRFRPRPLGEEHPWRQVEFIDKVFGDQITLSNDMKTITLELSAPHKTSDLIRVIVECRTDNRNYESVNREQRTMPRNKRNRQQ